MSHVTVIKSVPIKSVPALHKAVENLKSRGVKCKLEKGCRPRMYFPHQEIICDYVLRLDECMFDVGFHKEEGSSVYDILMDKDKGRIRNVIGTAGNNDNNHIGMLLQEYSKEAAKEAAINNGMFVEDCFMDKDNNVILVFA